MVNIFYDSYRILMRVYSDKTFIKQAINSEVIEPINKSAVIKICYGVIERDTEFEYYIETLCDKRPKLPVRVLIKIAIYNIAYLGKSPYAVTDNAVELCKKLGKGGMSGFLNAVLRKFIKTAPIPLPTEKIKNLSVKYSYPEFLVRNFIADYGEDVAIKIMETNEIKTFIRFKKGIDGEKYLNNLGKDFEKTPFKNCFAMKNFVREDGFFNGDYTFMSIGSVAICDIIEPTGDKKLLDCCAAPGGKSVYLSEKFDFVTADELHPHRVGLINDYVKRMGVENVKTEVADSTIFNSDYLEKFDVVFCDVPCSGSGVTIDNPDIRLNRSEEDIKNLNETQLAIIKNVSKYVKKGGCLYYSTCSILKRENDSVIGKFLKENKDFEKVDISSPLPHEKVCYGLQFLPHISSGAGFYVCKLAKNLH